MTDPLEHIRALSEGIGPRPSASEAERKAGEYIAGKLESFGYLVRTEPFKSVRSFGHVYLVVYLLSLAGAAVTLAGEPGLGLLLSGIGLVAFLGENTTALHLATTLIPKGKSQNIVGRLAPGDLPRRRLVIVSHYDTTRSGLMFHPRMVKGFRASFLLLTACMLAIPVLCAAGALVRAPALRLALIPFMVVVAYAVLLLLHRELFFSHVAGANDNASGIGVALSLAEALSVDAPADTEIMVVATGCEEVGMVGMQAFLRRHADELSRAWIINIDNVGAGDIHYVTEEGMLLRHKPGRELVDMAARVSSLPGLDVTGAPFRVASTDSEPAMMRGLAALTVIGLKDGIPVNYHWATDTFDNIDPDSVDTTYRFVEQMVRRLIA